MRDQLDPTTVRLEKVSAAAVDLTKVSPHTAAFSGVHLRPGCSWSTTEQLITADAWNGSTIVSVAVLPGVNASLMQQCACIGLVCVLALGVAFNRARGVPGLSPGTGVACMPIPGLAGMTVTDSVLRHRSVLSLPGLAVGTFVSSLTRFLVLCPPSPPQTDASAGLFIHRPRLIPGPLAPPPPTGGEVGYWSGQPHRPTHPRCFPIRQIFWTRPCWSRARRFPSQCAATTRSNRRAPALSSWSPTAWRS